jgi:signal transduction histidine kinase
MLRHKIYTNIIKQTLATEDRFVIYGVLALFGFTSFYFFNKSLNIYENFTIRFIAIVLSGLLIIKNYWPKSVRKILPFYWYFTILYSQPFFFSYMFFMNNGSSYWQINNLISLVILMSMTDIISMLFILTIGISFGYICFRCVSPFPNLPPDITPFFINFITLIICALLLYKKDKIQEEKLQIMKALAAAIAHEMRTPLAALGAGIRGIKKHLPILLSNYKAAQEAHLAAPSIDSLHYKSLENISNNMDILNKQANIVIDMMLLKVKDYPMDHPLVVCSIAECVHKAIEIYPFDSNQKFLIHSSLTPNFKFKGNQEFTLHILFNLFKNALYYIAAANKGEITIWTNITPEANFLHFKDTGPGVKAQHLPHIFEKFYSRTKHGSGLGLAFCKMVMKSFEGDIICKSVERKYTEFILKFPKIS